MIVVDANVLIYAVNESAPHHGRSKSWLEDALNGTEAIGFAWPALLAFLRLVTLPAVFPDPLDASDAFDHVDAWLEAPAATVIHPGLRHAEILRSLVADTGLGGNLVPDAHLAALAVEHSARLCTFDRDFTRFPGVSTIVP